MNELLWLAGGVAVGAVSVLWFLKRTDRSAAARLSLSELLADHLSPVGVNEITISERQFPYRVRADLQRALDHLFKDEIRVIHFCGVAQEYSREGVMLRDCLLPSEHNPAFAAPPEYEELAIGEDQPVRVLQHGLWLLENKGISFVVVLSPTEQYGQTTGMQVQVGMPGTPEGTRLTQEFFDHLEESIRQAASYRGKILSLEEDSHSYSGKSSGITVHSLRQVERDQVILPEATVSLLERNVIDFVKHRHRLPEFRQSTKKGLLFYGPPGTGKTHTIHYLIRALEGHTTLLVSAEQIGLLSEYMTLARLLQPSIVVLEDVDLIARDRQTMNGACEEILLNKLLNEMDGLKEDADILFVLTTNRPETLEAALASRPGRVDQAIEFPKPDDEGRRKLAELYSQGLALSEDVVGEVVRRTEGVSAAFIKELMRRAVQCHLESGGDGRISADDVHSALDEMLVRGGSLNLLLLGAESGSGSPSQPV